MRLLSSLLAFVLLSDAAFGLSPRDLIISEIAWMGTSASANHEWIELANTTDAPIDLAGFSLAAADGTPAITLSGVIEAGGFFLLERTSDGTIADIAADQIYTGALGNAGEDLFLRDAEGNELDRVDAWYGGDNTTKATMERSRADLPGTDPNAWATHDGSTATGLDADGNPIRGTPRAANATAAGDAPPEEENPPEENPEEENSPEEIPEENPDEENQPEEENPEEEAGGGGAPILFSSAAAGEIWINEIAWAGSSASTADEWIELVNRSEKTFDLAGFVLTGAGVSGTDFVIAAGTLAPGSYFLVSNNTETHSFSGGESVLAVAPDFVSSSLALSNSSLEIRLKDASGATIDTAGDGSAPFAGSSEYFTSMARLPTGTDGSIAGSWTASARADNLDPDTPDRGTPRAANFLARDLAIASFTASNTRPLPSEELTLTLTLENRGTDAAADFVLDLFLDDVFFTSESIPTLDAFSTLSIELPFTAAAGEQTIRATLGADDSATLALSADLRLLLSEFIPDPVGADATNEWIEIFNPTDAPIDLAGISITTSGGTLTIDAGTLAAGDFALVAADLASGLAWTGSWPTMKNSSDTVELRATDSSLLDSFSYSSVTEGRSYARSPAALSSWLTLRHPTPGRENVEENAVPTARITVQGTGRTSGTCSLFFNPDGRESSDPDGDALSFFWDFGNGQTSDAANPAGFYYPPGQYLVELTVTDIFETTSIATQLVSVSACSGSAASVPKKEEPTIVSLPAERVVLLITEVSFNDSPDWLEIFVVDDGAGGRGADFGGFFIEVDGKNRRTIPAGTFFKNGDFFLVEFGAAEESVSFRDGVPVFHSTYTGLTATDEQVTLRDSRGVIEDAVVWENGNGAWSPGEERGTQELVMVGAWDSAAMSAAVSSASIPRGTVIARKMNNEELKMKNTLTPSPSRGEGEFVDTNSAADWFVTPFQTPGTQNGVPPTRAGDVSLLLTAVAPKNPAGDRVTIVCVDCDERGTDLTGFSLKLGQAMIFTFPVGTRLTRGESFTIEDLRLTGADGLLTIKDFENTTEDFVCWTDRAAPRGSRYDYDLTMAEITQLEKRAREGAWSGDTPASCLDSRELPRGGSFIRMKNEELKMKNTTHSREEGEFVDTNSAADFEIAPPDDELAELIAATSDAIRISEILANPAGPDAGREWFELVNTGSEAVDLFDWTVVVGNSFFSFEDSIVLAAGEQRAFFGYLALRNTGATMTLIDPMGETIDSVEYPAAADDEAWARTVDGSFRVTSIPTPNAPNDFFRFLRSRDDRDGDGLSDEEELLLGTDPENPDSDGDGLPDFFEIMIGRDPLTPEPVTEAVAARYRGWLTTIVTQTVVSETSEERGLFVSGRGVPGGALRLFLQSELQIFDIPVDDDGVWSYTLDTALPAGRHNLFLQAVDARGFLGVATKVLSFNRETDFVPPTFSDAVVISEILPDPVGADATGEFIELWNAGTEDADLADWRLGVGSKVFTLSSAVIPAGDFLVIGGKDFVSDMPALRLASGLGLVNSGARVSLAWPTGRSVASLRYEKMKEGQVLALDHDAWPADAVYRVSTQASAGARNKIVAPVERSRGSAKLSYRDGDRSDQIFISEILPNPVGPDAKGEFIELYNSSSRAVNLGNWQLVDKSGKRFIIPDSVVLRPGGYHAFFRPETKIILKNTGQEWIALADPRGREMGRLSFADVAEGASLALDPASMQYRTTTLLTPSAANLFDTRLAEGLLRFVGAERVVLETAAGEVSVALPEKGVGLLARALLRAGDRVTLAVDTDGVLRDFTILHAVPREIASPALPLWRIALLVLFSLIGLLLSLPRARKIMTWTSRS